MALKDCYACGAKESATKTVMVDRYEFPVCLTCFDGFWNAYKEMKFKNGVGPNGRRAIDHAKSYTRTVEYEAYDAARKIKEIDAKLSGEGQPSVLEKLTAPEKEERWLFARAERKSVYRHKHA